MVALRRDRCGFIDAFVLKAIAAIFSDNSGYFTSAYYCKIIIAFIKFGFDIPSKNLALRYKFKKHNERTRK